MLTQRRVLVGLAFMFCGLGKQMIKIYKIWGLSFVTVWGRVLI